MDVVVVVLVFIDWMAFESLKQTRARFSINLHALSTFFGHVSLLKMHFLLSAVSDCYLQIPN